MNRLSLVLIVMLAASMFRCSEMVSDSPVHGEALADVEAAWKITRDVYPYFSFKKINWDSLHSIYTARAGAAHGDEAYTVLFDMLRELHDGHVSLVTEGGASVRTFFTRRELRDENAFSPQVVRHYFHEPLLLAGDNKMEYGILDGNIGYVRFATFIAGDWVSSFAVVLNYLRATDGMIIDLRHNGGGGDGVGFSIISRFISTPLDLFTTYYRGIKNSGYYVQPSGPYTYEKPVIVLINGKCFSATEDIAEVMKHAPTFTLVGDTTAGASGAPQTFILPSGKRIAVSTIDIRRYDGEPIEWNGIIPDIRVPQTEADIRQGRDPQLERAVNELTIRNEGKADKGRRMRPGVAIPVSFVN